MAREDAPWGILDELAAKIQSRCEEADRTGDQVGAARWRAMAAVVATKLIPLACPDAVTVAGDAARAACEGQAEPDWYAATYSQHGWSHDGRAQLNLAIRLLRSADLWPWKHNGRDDRPAE